jgi:hypothetical protein
VSLKLLEREVDGRKFRLIGVGCTDLTDANAAAAPDLFNVQLPPATTPASHAAVVPSLPQSALFGKPVSQAKVSRSCTMK